VSSDFCIFFPRRKKVEERMSAVCVGEGGRGGGVPFIMPAAFPEAAGSVDGVNGRGGWV